MGIIKTLNTLKSWHQGNATHVLNKCQLGACCCLTHCVHCTIHVIVASMDDPLIFPFFDEITSPKISENS